MVQGEYKEPLSYELIGEEGPDHDKKFIVSAKIGDAVITTGSGRTKKAAEQAAAYAAIIKLKNQQQKGQEICI